MFCAIILLCLYSNDSDPFSINFIYYYVLLMCFLLLILLLEYIEIHVNILCVDGINDGRSRTHTQEKGPYKFYYTENKPSSGHL